jgi:predicted permease
MSEWSSIVRAQVSGLGLDPTREAEIVDELSSHLADRHRELVSGGLDEDQARRIVLEEVAEGKLTAALAASPMAGTPPARPEREQPGVPAAAAGLFAGVLKDLGLGFRLLLRDPAFSLVAVVSLALGIGANMAIFQLLDAVRLRSLPVRDPGSLVTVKIVYKPNGRSGGFTGEHPDLTTAQWERLLLDQRAFSSLASWSSERVNLAPGGEARWANGLYVSGGFFSTLGVRPELGRLLGPADDRPGCPAAGAVISHAFWQRELGGERSAIGSRLTVEGHPVEIVGVAPSYFFGVDVGRRFDVAVPACFEPVVRGEEARTTNHRQWWLAAFGRLNPGWTVEKASAHLASISPGLFQSTVPDSFDEKRRKNYLEYKLGASPISSGWSGVREDYESPLWLLLGISGLVLLIACANLANLMVARASARQKEIAVRLALGASRGRLIRQLLAESLALASVGAVLGALIGQAVTRVLVSYLSTSETAVFVDLSPDWHIFAFMAGLVFATAVLFGLAPALQASRAEPTEALKSGARGIAGARSRFGVRRALVVSQVALSLVLLVGALLFVRTLRNLSTVDAGFRQDRILFAELDLTQLAIPPGARQAYRRGIVEDVGRIPGVRSASSVFIVPISGAGWNDQVKIVGSAAEEKTANFNRVGPRYFETMGTPLIAGRDFDDRDTASSMPVAIVTTTFARQFTGGASPIGRELTARPRDVETITYRIVGLVGDAKYGELREDFSPIVFVPQSQDREPSLGLGIAIRSDLSTGELAGDVRRVVASKSPAIVVNFRDFARMLRESLMRERLMATLSGFFGGLAAVLAMIGLYGVISYLVVRRRNEFGVRMALGAGRREILALVMREAGLLLAIGVGTGVVLSLAASRAAGALLYGLKPGDPLTLALAISGLAAVAVAASLLPARRAAALDPMDALRDE